MRSFDEQIKLYLSCAKQLHRSLKDVGFDLVVLTNDKNFLDRLNGENYDIEIVQIDFTLIVPAGVKFYSAHFKLQVYEYLASLEENYVGLLDCDIVCINDVPEAFKNAIQCGVPLYYDISDQVTAAYGHERIIADKQRLSNSTSLGLWGGGEFVCGPPNFFQELYNEVESIVPLYFSNFNSFHHQGDEMLTSVAIENLKLRSNLKILDAGVLSIIARFWSPKTLHVQKSIEAYSKHFLLHLPSDKKFIAALHQNELKGEIFFKKYKHHLFISRILENAYSGLKPYVKKARAKFLK